MIPGRFPSASGKPLSALIRAALLILASASAGGGLGANPMDKNSAAVSNPPPAQAKNPASPESLVIATERLDIDFSKHLVTFIELGADKCIPCKAMQPIMREIAAEYKDQVQVIFYDVWKNPEPGRRYGIQLIPTQVFIDKTGKEIFRHVGLFPKEELVAFLKKQGVR